MNSKEKRRKDGIGKMKVTLTGETLNEYEKKLKFLSEMSKEERLNWFEENAGDDFAFGLKIDGTTYIARCVFKKPKGETLYGKTCRILVNDDNV